MVDSVLFDEDDLDNLNGLNDLDGPDGLDDLDDLDDDLEDGEDDQENGLSDDDVIQLAALDGMQDGSTSMPKGGSYGMSVDLDDLTDEQRDLYDSEYYAGYDSEFYAEHGDDWGEEDLV